MVLMKATDVEMHSFFYNSFSSAYGLRPRGFIQTWIVCGEKSVEIWIQIDPSFPSDKKRWPSGVEWNGGRNDASWLSQIRHPQHLDPGAWKGISLISDAVRPPGATDWIMVQGRSLRASSASELKDDSKIGVDTDGAWTLEEERILVSMRKQKKSFAEIAGKLRKKELQVACKYVNMVSLPRAESGGRRESAPQAPPESAVMYGLSLYILWIGYEAAAENSVNRGGWRVYGYCEVHCESKDAF
jgi:hypothetical protein